MRQMRLLRAGFALALVLGPASASSAQTPTPTDVCACPTDDTIEAQVQRAGAVYTARVISAPEPGGAEEGDTALLRVLDVYHGRLSPGDRIRQPAFTGDACSLGFEKDQEWLILSFDPRGEGTGTCSGSTQDLSVIEELDLTPIASLDESEEEGGSEEGEEGEEGEGGHGAEREPKSAEPWPLILLGGALLVALFVAPGALRRPSDESADGAHTSAH